MYTHKKRLAKLSSKVLASTLAAAMVMTSVNVPATKVEAAGNYNYGDALSKSLLFYQLQESGKLTEETTSRTNWRADSCLNDGKDVGVDLTGGWYDAGDNVKFNLPMAYSSMILAWSYINNPQAYAKSGQAKWMLHDIKWANDYFVKCNPDSKTYYYQVGDGGADHSFWGSPEVVEYKMKRPSYKVDDTSANGGSAVTGEAAASLAAASIVLKSTDASRSATYLAHAKTLFGMAERAMSDAGYTAASGYYNSWSGFYDELSLAAGWLYKATGDKTYLAKAKEYATNFGSEFQGGDEVSYSWPICWDDVHLAAELMLAELTGEKEYYTVLENSIDCWSGVKEGTNPISFTGGGLGVISQWGSIRYACNEAFLCTIYNGLAKADSTHTARADKFIEKTVNYVLGASGRSFMCGYDSTSPVNPHHRAAHGCWLDNLSAEPETSRHVLVGAVVGGPTGGSDSSYVDKRSDYTANEVACDYNAGFTGACAYMYEKKGFGAVKDASAIETPDGKEFSVEAGINAQDKNNKINFVELKLMVRNKTAWPSRVSDKLVVRLYFDLSDTDPAAMTIGSAHTDYAGTKFSAFKPTSTKGIYYVDVDLSGAKIYPGGQSQHRCEIQMRVSAPGKWDYSKSPCLQGIGGTSNMEMSGATPEGIVLYENGKVVFGKEYNGSEAPTVEPTKAPTKEPTKVPTQEPTKEPTKAPTVEPTKAPTQEPTKVPSTEVPTPGKEGRDASVIVNDMLVGWNLGNALDSKLDGASLPAMQSNETSWGNPVISKKLIDEVAKAGFNTIRIPVSWGQYMDPSTMKIQPFMLKRVKEVVDYALDNDMYVILNCHHDINTPNANNCFYYPNKANQTKSEKFFKELWTQVGNTFKNYDDRLIFETMNEPRLVGHSEEWWFPRNNPSSDILEAIDMINSYNQVALDAMRATGGNNATRCVLVPGYDASLDSCMMSQFKLPKDSAKNKLIVSVHAYYPYYFALCGDGQEVDEFDRSNKSDIDNLFKELNQKYLSKNVPVVISEMGCTNRNKPAERIKWANYYFGAQAKYDNVACVIWDNNVYTNGTNGEMHGYIDRKTYKWHEPDLMAAIFGSLGGKVPSTEEPTKAPTKEPTKEPTKVPTQEPTKAPTQEPTKAPTKEPTKAPTQEPTKTPTDDTKDGITYEFSVKNEWPQGFLGEITIYNNTSKDINGWTATCDTDAKINDVWGGQLVKQTGSTVTVKNTEWNPTIAAHGSITIGFVASGDASKCAPTNIKFNGTSISGDVEEPTKTPTQEPTKAPTKEPTKAPTQEPTKAPSTESDLTVTTDINNWNSGYQVQFIVANKTNKTVDGWTLKVSKKDISIDSSWNVNIKEENGYYVITPMEWNKTIAAGNTVEFGVQGKDHVADKLDVIVNGKTISGSETSTKEPTKAPTKEPTKAPTKEPTKAPTKEPTKEPATKEPATKEPSTKEPSTTDYVQGDDWLHTDGTKILDKNNNEVFLTGANWFGFNCTERVVHGLWCGNMKKIIYTVADHGINIIRIPISTQLLLEWKNGQEKEVDFNRPGNLELHHADGTYFTSREAFDYLLDLCKINGIKIMMDLHSNDADNNGHMYPLWYNDNYSTEDWIEGWVWFANEYKNDDTIIACDLKNEPHGKFSKNEALKAKWDDSKDENNWQYAASRCGQAILEVNPNLLIMVEGIEETPKPGYDYNAGPQVSEQDPKEIKKWNGAWWGGNLRNAGKYPVDLGKHQSQLVYSPHDYGPKVYAQEWFKKDFTEETLLDDVWRECWFYLYEDGIAPLLIGEWGGFMDGGDNEKYLEIMAEFIAKNKLHHTFWAINPNSGDTGGLLKDDWLSWDMKKYNMMKKTLWQSGGKFVGLDHEIPLGTNGTGISVGDLY